MMPTYRVQVKMIDYRQVDIEADKPLSWSELQEEASKQAQAEFGDCDDVDIVGGTEYVEIVRP